MKSQGSFEAIIGVVACVFLFAVALGYLSISASLVSESYRRARLSELAVVLSNDVLLNPGYLGHFGLALYNPNTRSVEEHFLDSSKVCGIPEVDREELKRQWGIEHDFCLRVEEVGGEEEIDREGRWENCPKAGNGGDVYRVVRLGLMGRENETKVVRLVFELYE